MTFQSKNPSRSSMRCVRRLRTKRPSRGLVLLMALGMLALFSLLAVTYVVSASSSRSASASMRTRSRAENIAFEGATSKIFNMALRGTNDQRSPFYGKDILGDIFGRNAITAKFGHPRMVGNAPIPNEFNPYWCKGIAGRFIKVSLDLNSALGLSPNENAYNSRLLTIQEGPLAGQTFRIIKYVGLVRSPLNGDAANAITDPNYAQLANAPSYPQLPWASLPNSYLDPFGADIDHSVLIDISEIQGEFLTGQIFNAAGGLETITKPVAHWLQDDESIRSLFFYVDPAQPLLSYPRYTGYKCVINDAPFNSPGIGIEDSRIAVGSLVPDFGNIDNRRLIQGGRVSPALLTDYNYLADPTFMVTPVPGIGIPTGGMHLLGQSNEGTDVPDYRDPWLAHQGAFFNGSAWQRRAIPSFHRPEVMYYIANLFGNPSSLTQAQRMELLRLLDASTSRIMSYQLTDNNGNVVLQSNPNFRSEDASYPRLSTNSIADLQSFVLQHINGPWDFDNDGDGIPDSILMDSGLPATKGPDGKLVKPVVAMLIEDLDGRLNINLHGDRIQGKISGPNPFRALTTLPGYIRRNELVPQGYGFGPGDISLNGIFNHIPGLIDNPILGNNTTSFSIFDDRFGARRYRGRMRNFSETFAIAALQDASLDRMPGRRMAGLPADDWVSRPFERDMVANVPSGRRSSYATTFDVNGNMVFVSPTIDDANPAAMLPAQAQLPLESDDDPYDASSLGTTNGDDPFSIAELESLLRRFDNDASALPTRLKERLLQDPRNRRVANDATSPYDINKLLLNSELLRQITTHSVELTHPKIGSAMVETSVVNGNTTASGISGPPASFLEFIKQLHKQRYQNRQGVGATNDPELNTAALVALFPIDFANGLKMDLNRPFGNGRDDDGDGQVDEPQEIRFWIANNPTYVDEAEASLEYVSNAPSSVPVKGIHGREVRFIRGSQTTRVQLSARQAFARSLYCLGQLIIPRSFVFPSMKNLTAAEVGSFKWYRLRANAIAQWAVNVVDFRDSDSAMTRFEYDIFPFGIGVMPTGAAGNYPTSPAKLAYWAPDYVHLTGSGVERELVDVVWGMEMPELLLTESLAFHDKRIRDTDMDSSSKTVTDQNMPDDDFDQYRMPEGSTFLELYVPRTTTIPGGQTIPPAMRSLFVQDTDGIMKLDLGRTIASGGNFGQQPVWRIGISEHYAPNSNPQNPNVALQTSPDSLLNVTHQFNSLATGTTAPGPNVNPDMVIGSGLYYDSSSKSATPPGVSANTLEFDRMIWFSSYSGQQVPNLTNTNTKSRMYYNRSANAPRVIGGGYAVVGPRTDTHVGSLTANPISGHTWVPALLRSSLGQNSPEIPVRSPSHQRIRLNANSVSTKYLDQNNTDPNTAESVWSGRIKPAVGIVCAADIPDNGWQDAYPEGVGLNISMPHPVTGQNYWTNTNLPNNRLNESDRLPRADNLPGYGDSTFPKDSWVKINPAPISGLFPDRPFDYPDPNGGGQTMNPILNPTSGTPTYRTGTYQNVRVAYLQRLADPEFGYDPVMNPYITVDWISMDLTVFNGEAPFGADPLEANVSATSISFQSRYKDGDVITTMGKNPNSFVTGQPNNNTGYWGFSYYSPSTAQMRSTVPQSDPTVSNTYPSYFKHQLGFATLRNATRPGSSASTLGYANVGYRFGQLSNVAEIAADTEAQYDGFGPPINNPTDSLLDGATKRLTSVNWLNRPFASPHEIMLVPFTSASQFGTFHSVATHSNDQRHPFRYLPSFQTSNAWRIDRQRDPVNDQYDEDQLGYWAQPRTQTSRKLNNTRNANGEFAPTQESDLPLLFEFVETRPPFSDARKQFPATAIVNTLDSPGPSATARDIEFNERMLDSHIRQNYMQANDPDFLLGPTLRPPQHMSSQFRAAGKPNLNTIAIESTGRSSVLKGIEYNYLTGTDRAGALPDTDTADPLTAMFAEGRRGFPLGVTSTFFTGYAGPQPIPTHLNPNYPTQFAGAYRSPLTANLAPHVNDITAQAKLRSKFGVETTLARSLVDPILANPALASLPASAQPSDAMLFSPPAVNGVNGTMPASSEATSDANRNPWTRMQREMRLPNLVSNQSNVYAMWITVTLYEYDPQNGFGNEYLDAQGVPVRERAFYIIDRSIPVGYKPGEDLNTDRTVLLKRKLDN